MGGIPFKKGNIPWNSGKNYSGMSGKKSSEETKKKISEAKKGKKRKPFSEQWKKRLGNINRGKKFTEEHKRKISESLKGKIKSASHIEKLKRIKGEIHWHWQGGITKGKECKCTNCNKIIIKYRRPKNKEKPFCNLKCSVEYHKGENCKTWKGGITPLYRARFNPLEYKEILKKVYTRDHWTCQKCGNSKRRIEAHHKIPWRVSQDDGIDNLITLCVPCHRSEEKKWRLENE